MKLYCQLRFFLTDSFYIQISFFYSVLSGFPSLSALASGSRNGFAVSQNLILPNPKSQTIWFCPFIPAKPDLNTSGISKIAVHLNAYLLSRKLKHSPVRDIQVHVQSLSVCEIHILSHGRQCPRNIRRTARHAEPGLSYRLHMLLRRPFHTVIRPYLQWIHIEEALPVLRDPGQYRIIKSTLRHIHIRSIPGKLRHPLPEESQAYRRASLRIITTVGKVVIRRKPLKDTGGSDTSRDVHPSLCHILPDRLTCSKQLFILIHAGKIRHRTVHIYRPHSMPFRRLLLPHRKMRL